MNLYEKMFAVMNDSESIEKSMTVGSGKNSYRAVSEAAMLNMVKPLLKKHRLIIFPIDGEVKDHCMVWNKTDYNGNIAENLRAMTELKVIYRIQDIDSKEFQDVVGFGNGSDPQDKGAGKASTYSLKNVLSKTFMLFSGEDTDTTHSDDIGVNKQSKDSDDVETVITTQMLIEMAKSKGIDETEICKKYKVSDVKYIKKDIKKEAYETYKKINEEPTTIDSNKVEAIRSLASKKGIIQVSICAKYNITKFDQMTFEVWREATEKLESRPDKKIVNKDEKAENILGGF
ncbi:ERF family protein [Clostridium estertheticum]|uniref:ERF family protein n=1 Tax=Clostridium estertheticum TaxID=238834 RepID=UPI001C7D294E|nr:ERF family protein [Clostridium estertheticum]MBX4266588.1 ERF family protein [Clostridium estertheticum]WLC88074.1 ERF family protein [Clostridium estertheticum]